MGAGRGICSQGADYKREETQRAGYTGWATCHLRLFIKAISIQGKKFPTNPTLRIKRTRVQTAHKKGESEDISYVFKVFLLKRYLRSSTGSPE
jgi:hypothetical protein